MSLVLDTGPILALLDRDDPDHARCVALVDGTAEDLVVPAPVLVEVDYWCRKLLGVRRPVNSAPLASTPPGSAG